MVKTLRKNIKNKTHPFSKSDFKTTNIKQKKTDHFVENAEVGKADIVCRILDLTLFGIKSPLPQWSFLMGGAPLNLSSGRQLVSHYSMIISPCYASSDLDDEVRDLLYVVCIDILVTLPVASEVDIVNVSSYDFNCLCVIGLIVLFNLFVRLPIFSSFSHW